MTQDSYSSWDLAFISNTLSVSRTFLYSNLIFKDFASVFLQFSAIILPNAIEQILQYEFHVSSKVKL